MDQPKSNFSLRAWIIWLVCLLLLVSLEARLIDLQIFRYPYYTAAADSQRKRASELLPHRGTIYMTERAGTSDSEDIFPVASNTKGWLVYAVPRDMDDPAAVADKLASALLAFRQRQHNRSADILISTGQVKADELSTPAQPEQTPEEELNQTRDQLKEKFDQRTDPYEPILKPYEIIDEEFRQFLSDNQLPGIVVEEQEVRTYPEKSLAAHILGYLGYEESGLTGRYGIEGYWQQNLAGSLGFLSLEKDTAGQYIGVGSREFTPAHNGDDVVLTIDRVVQSYIEDELRQGVEKYQAERGSIIVMNPATGSVLGMATYPTFDPNYYYAINDPRVQLNPIISEIFEPGSVLKPLIMAAAIDTGKVTPSTTMVDSGPVQVADRVINTFDGQHHSVQTMTQILEQSNNVGMVWVGQQLGAETIYDYLRRFGLGEKTGIRLEGETQTSLQDPKDWNIVTTATTSFGQGIALTPLQELDAINTLANQGKLMRPYVVGEVRSSDGTVTKTDPVEVRQVVSPQTAETLAAMMVSVIENGVGLSARVPGYYMAGKTGTAQVPDERGKYSPDRKIISFVGFGPVEHPKFSVIIKLDNPAGLSFASGTAAPMFRSLSAKLLQYYQIPPSYDTAAKPKFVSPGSAG
ncbi:MAG: penicillin-binding protein 2 [bacterium]|nr:penicillin-binding protein 2 [bacterium]MDZ4342315.1 penicillin-binding protein 2 [Candidatus Binatia bacterium]